MTNQFEPFFEAKDPNDFNSWEYLAENKDETIPQVDEQETLLLELEQLRQEAREKGYREGLLQAQEEIRQKNTELDYWLGLLQNPVQLIDSELTQEMIQALIWLCQFCIGIELSASPDKIQPIIEEIKIELSSLRGRKELIMCPSDIEWLKQHLGEDKVADFNVNLVEDPSLSRGDFFLKGENSDLDGRLHSRLITICSKYIAKDNLIEPLNTQE